MLFKFCFMGEIYKITERIKSAVTATIPDITLILYGSYARGDYRPDSDIDLLVLLNKDKITFADRMKITAPLYTIELETGIIISSFIYAKRAWDTIQIKTPFYENVMKEGIIL